ncbi:MAG: HlyD family efflux transporter periplasmic adaptor subunit [Eubacteriales bacterium]
MKKSTKKRIIIYSSVVVVIIAAVLINKGVKAKKETMAQFDVSPSTAVAEIGDIGIYVPASGTISSGNTETVFANTQGTVLKTYFKEGDFVNAGEVIAVVESETLEDEIKAAQNSVYSKRSSIDEYDNDTQDYTIKSPVYGRVKEINLKHVNASTSEIYRERAEDVEDEYGYLASIAVGDNMYIKATGDISRYEVGQEVDAVIHQSSGDVRIYSGSYVEKIEDGAAYIYINSNKYEDDVNADIYTADGKTKIGEGVTEYFDIQYIVGAKGYIKSFSTFINQLVNQGDILFYSYTNIDQGLSDMYAELENLEEQLTDLQTQYTNLEIKAPVSGFISSISVAAGSEVTSATEALRIADTSIWSASVDVDELDVNSIEIGMAANVTIDAIVDEIFEGTVKRISSVGSYTSGVTTYTVEIEVPADERFKLSMNASSEIEVQKVEDVITLPIEAVRYMGDRAYVLVYTERTDDEIDEIIDQILDSQKQSEELAKMSQEEMQEYMAEQREAMLQVSDGADKEQFDPSKMDAVSMPLENAGGFRASASANLSIADQLYGEIVYVEVGIQDETNIQILSGLEAGDVVLLSISDTSTESTSTSINDGPNDGGFNMMPGGLGGMGGGR